MSKSKKDFLSISPGSPVGSIVIDGNINAAISEWKRRLKDSHIIVELYRRREYIKKSTKRRQIIQDAEYRQKRKDDENT